MKHSAPAMSSGESGFTLLEVLAGLVLASLILVSLNLAMTVVGKGVDRTRDRLGQQSELSTAMEVFGRDVAKIEKIRRGTSENFEGYLFDGREHSMIYPVRETEGVTTPSLHLVRLSAVAGKNGVQLLRERAPLPRGLASTEGIKWRDPVVLIEGDHAITFAYRAPRSGVRGWSGKWQAGEAMPEQIRVEIADPSTGVLRVPGFVQSLAIDTEVNCAGNREQRCGTAKAQEAPQ